MIITLILAFMVPPNFLADDLDGDGFYQTFSVIFDADIYSYTASPWGEVYALLYLSKNGGPWVHYFTTDYFIIEGESDTDEYEVMTTFLSGYNADYYDVLIDLYQVGYNDIVASYSSDDDNALYALSLESADHDEPYIEVVQVHGGGSFSIMSLLIVLIIVACKSLVHRK
ncbi:choice-of-anchor H family protein [Colwellia sp. MSW7]|uniref:Choice-of-anchor H family protein n=1 Tax=Colwellia maritima TaxID=2912588 RepID=A0ABS9X527_9GAMM|nr:choice-of-anchor H family protein [Colwellia maritima]MCI2285180.1 choice-of-anchor H family protein [Colwellia maritima]